MSHWTEMGVCPCFFEINVFVEQYVSGILPLDQAFCYAIADAITNN